MQALDPQLLEELKLIPGVFVRSGALRCTPDVAPILQRKGLPFDLIRRPSRVAPDPLLARRMMQHQRTGSIDLRADRIRALFWSTGVGKTAASLTASVPPVLIVTRPIARHVFPRDGAWTWPGAQFAILLGSGKQSKGLDYTIRKTDERMERYRERGATIEVVGSVADVRNAPFVVVGWQTLEHHWEELAALRRWETVIFDESHMAAGRMAQRARAAQGIAACSVRSWLLTATPQPNRRADLFMQLALIDRDAWGSNWKCVHRYCDARMNDYGGLDTNGKSFTAELVERISYWSSVLTRKDVGSTLPPGTREIMRIDAGKKLVRIPTDRHRRGMEAALAWAAEVKIQDLAARVVECLIGMEKVVLVGGRRAWVPRALKAVLAKLKRAPRHIRERAWIRATSGVDPIYKRVALAEEYQDQKELACLIATIDSIGQSIDLHFGDRALIAFLPYTPLQIIQLEGRFVRTGGWPQTIEYWVADGTFDEAIEETLLSKLDDVVDVGVSTAEVGLQSVARETEESVIAELSDWLAQRASAIDGAVLDTEDY